MSPQRVRTAGAPAHRLGRGPHGRVGVQDEARETLKDAGLGGVDTDVPQLHLRPRPRECRRTHEGVCLLVLVDEIQDRLAGRGNAGPERNAHGGACRDAHPIPKREHRIQDRAHGVGQAPSFGHGDGC